MKTQDFTEINTLLSVREESLLTESQFETILNAKDEEDVAIALEETKYNFHTQDLTSLDIIEKKLMNVLVDDYRFAYRETPHSIVVNIFASKYMYHNLKVIFKMLVTDYDLEHLYIPIGRFSMDELYHVVQTGESQVIPKQIIERIKSTWEEYQIYKDTEAIDIGMDMAYFDHLRDIAETVNDEDITNIVNVFTDFYNIISLKRSITKDKPRSFMHEILTERGTKTIEEFIEIVMNDRIHEWFDELNQSPYDTFFTKYIEKMQDGSIRTVELERLQQQYMHNYIANRRFEEQGPLPLISYLFYKEMEVKNLRLVLTGRLNGLPKEKIMERLRPIYGQEV